MSAAKDLYLHRHSSRNLTVSVPFLIFNDFFSLELGLYACVWLAVQDVAVSYHSICGIFKVLYLLSPSSRPRLFSAQILFTDGGFWISSKGKIKPKSSIFKYFMVQKLLSSLWGNYTTSRDLQFTILLRSGKFHEVQMQTSFWHITQSWSLPNIGEDRAMSQKDVWMWSHEGAGGAGLGARVTFL